MLLLLLGKALRGLAVIIKKQRSRLGHVSAQSDVRLILFTRHRIATTANSYSDAGAQRSVVTGFCTFLVVAAVVSPTSICPPGDRPQHIEAHLARPQFAGHLRARTLFDSSLRPASLAWQRACILNPKPSTPESQRSLLGGAGEFVSAPPRRLWRQPLAGGNKRGHRRTIIAVQGIM